MRRQELDGFIEGLFGHEEMIDLPKWSRRSRADARALFEAVVVLAVDDAKPVTDKGMETTLRHIREMTRNAEHEIHAIILTCTRARRQMLAGLPTARPTLH
jgi:hypothetical protein